MLPTDRLEHRFGNVIGNIRASFGNMVGNMTP